MEIIRYFFNLKVSVKIFIWLLPLSHIHITIHYLKDVPLSLPPLFHSLSLLFFDSLSLSLMRIARLTPSCVCCVSNCARFSVACKHGGLSWYQLGLSWYQHGINLVSTWYQLGINLVSTWH
jgi:hypothetical protein